ncbi:hypothetical protein [Novosphingobium sp.]|uniref:hypothetical protein n=1 Tax=Novosphingobium sp. TaxID=1874826 RepID=UPI0038B9BD28
MARLRYYEETTDLSFSAIDSESNSTARGVMIGLALSQVFWVALAVMLIRF